VSTLSPPVRAFLASAPVGVLATEREDGHPHQSLIYFNLDDDTISISTLAGRIKTKHVERTGWASLCVMGHERPFPSVTVAGPARIRSEAIGEATARIAAKAMGQAEPPEPQTDEALAAVGRVILEIEVEQVGPVSYVEGA
jgi:PPOX class probable F420-dependent enzyme